MPALGVSQARAAVALAVRRMLADIEATQLVLVACSGGADSLALAAGAADWAKLGREGKNSEGQLRLGALIVDHGLQPGSAQVAQTANAQCRALGLDPVAVLSVKVEVGPGNGGLEAAARDARRLALVREADALGAQAILLAHTLDDQAETVLLGLARGSGARSLAAMRPIDGRWRRPLLGLRRQQVRAACLEAGLVPFDDPHNLDHRFARVRAREVVLPLTEQELGPGVAEALARTASLLRADCDALDTWAARESRDRVVVEGSGVSVALATSSGDLLSEVPVAVRTRILRSAILAAGCPRGSITAGQLLEVDRLVSDWRGQGAIRLAGDVEVTRASGKLLLQDAGPLMLHGRG